MKTHKKLVPTILFIASICFVTSKLSAQQFKVLLITETAGWHHESIDYGVIAVSELAKRHNFEGIQSRPGNKSSFVSIIKLPGTLTTVTDKVQPVLSGQPREVAKVAAKARWLLKSGVDNANPVFIVMNIDCNTYITE